MERHIEPTVSIIIPVYNGEKYIKRCIDSICNQTYSNLQIIIVDDGSKDKTRSIVKTIIEKDDRVELYIKENAGVSQARNYGLQQVRGQYVSFVDADDWIDKSLIEDNIKIVKEQKCDLIINDFFYEKKGQTERAFVLNEMVGPIDIDMVKKQWIISDDINYVWINMYDADIIEKNHLKYPLDITCGEDAIFNGQYVNCSDTVYYSKKAYYHYEIHDNSACRHLVDDSLEQNDILYKTKKAFAEKWGRVLNNREYRRVFLQTMANHYCVNLLFADATKQRDTFTKWLKTLFETECFLYILKNKNEIKFDGIPKTYKILTWLLINKKVFAIRMYCKLVNFLLSHTR